MSFAAVQAPHIDYAGLSPFVALAGGTILVLLLGLLPGRWVRHGAPAAAIAVLGAAIGLAVWRFHDRASLVSGALRVDELVLVLVMTFSVAGIAAVLLAWRALAAEEAGPGEFFALIVASILGMAVLVAAQNLVTLFLGFELLSIPLYVLCATELRRERSLESGLKYLIVGSVGSATLVYGLALIYGATGSTDFAAIARAIGGDAGSDALLLAGIGLTLVGLAFKASVAPFHQWTPDVYEGAPTPVTAFMAVATKAAALGVLLRLFDVALIGAQSDWGPALAALATITILVGNVGALGQGSLKRMLAYSGVAQAGYLLAGVIVGTQLGAKATVFYLVVYLAMNLAAFAAIVARERASALVGGDDLANFEGLGRTHPSLAWPLTIAMLALAGIPATAGFVGKLYLIEALVDGDYAWLAIVLVVGSMISLGYYLRVVAALWMREEPATAVLSPALRDGVAPPVMAGGSQEADAELDARAQPELLLVAWLAAAATLVLGVVPSPLFRLAGEAGRALTGLF